MRFTGVLLLVTALSCIAALEVSCSVAPHYGHPPILHAPGKRRFMEPMAPQSTFPDIDYCNLLSKLTDQTCA